MRYDAPAGPLSAQACKVIEGIIRSMIERVIKRRLDDPFDVDAERSKKPFDFALVPEEIWIGAKFERSYVTSRGMVAWERIAAVVAEDNGCNVETQCEVEGIVTEEQVRVIHEILRDLECGRTKPSWSQEARRVIAAKREGNTLELRVISDLYFRHPDGPETFVELKASLPNSDQTKVSKEKMLKLIAMDPEYQVYFALPDNPFMDRARYAHAHARRWFDMREDPVVVMGDGFWDRVVGQPGTFNQLVAIAETVGQHSKRIIREQYLGRAYGSGE